MKYFLEMWNEFNLLQKIGYVFGVFAGAFIVYAYLVFAFAVWG